MRGERGARRATGSSGRRRRRRAASATSRGARRSTGSMTTAGAAGLMICQSELWKSRKFAARSGSGRARACATRSRGCRRTSTSRATPAAGPQWHYYYLYGLERMGILAHTRFLGQGRLVPRGGRAAAARPGRRRLLVGGRRGGHLLRAPLPQAQLVPHHEPGDHAERVRRALRRAEAPGQERAPAGQWEARLSDARSRRRASGATAYGWRGTRRRARAGRRPG